jgi:hypothetical protein
MEPRKCKGPCGDTLPLNLFATYKRKGEVKYMYRCKDCHRALTRERQRKWVEENREKHNERTRDNKRKAYQNKAGTRAKAKQESNDYYWRNRERVLDDKREKYQSDEEYRAAVLARQHTRYHKDDFCPTIRGRDELEFEDVLAEVRGEKIRSKVSDPPLWSK